MPPLSLRSSHFRFEMKSVVRHLYTVKKVLLLVGYY